MRRMLATSALLVLAACGCSSIRTAKPESTAEHGAGLAVHESADLAAHLVAVPGYTYVDPPADEIDATLAELHRFEDQNDSPEFFSAASFHGVVADNPLENRSGTAAGGWEVGYLVLTSFRYAPPAGLERNAAYFTSRFDGTTHPEHLTIAGVDVFKFDDPDRPESAFVYMWLRHGVQGWFDGADDGPMERWLQRYLATPVLSPNENDVLARRLVALDGFVYVNAPDLTDFATTIGKAYGSAPYSIHKLANRRSSMGSLALVEPTLPMSTEGAAAAFVTALSYTIGPAEFRTIDDVTAAIHDMGDDMTLVVWVVDRVVAILIVDANQNPVGIVNELIEGWRAVGIGTTESALALDTPRIAANT